MLEGKSEIEGVEREDERNKKGEKNASPNREPFIVMLCVCLLCGGSVVFIVKL